MTETRVEKSMDVKRVREDFPILHQTVHGKDLVYLDNAASTQKPLSVIEEITRFYSEDNANIHRGVHALSVRSTELYEGARERAAKFLNASDAKEIVFVRGTTEAVNLVAHSFVRPRLQEGDEIIITAMEHHSNLVPWQLVCEQTGAQLRVISTVGGLATDTATFVGQAGAEAEITDSLTGRRLAAGVDRRVGTKTLRGVGGEWKQVELTFQMWAERLRKRLAGARSGSS